MLRLLDADPRSRMPGGASRLWVVVISAVVMADTALPMVMSSDTADPVDSAAPAEVAQFAAAEETVTLAEAASGAVGVAPARVAVAPPAVPTISSQIPAKSPPKTLFPPPPQAPPPSPETLLEKQKRLEKEAELLEQERKKLQEDRERLIRNAKAEAEAIRQRQRNLMTSLNYTCWLSNSAVFIAPLCPFAYDDSEPIVEVHDTAYEINLDIPGLRKEDLTISVSNDALRSEWGSNASVSDSGKVLQIIGRTANANMDVGIARAVQLYSDADFDKGLNTTHADGRLTIRVARQTSATLPLWSTWQLQGHLHEKIVWNNVTGTPYIYSGRYSYYVHFKEAKLKDVNHEKLKDVNHEKGRCQLSFCIKIPSLQWLTQAPIQALKFLHDEMSRTTANLPLYVPYKWRENDYYSYNVQNNDAINEVFTSINETISKALSHIEDSGGYNIILKRNANYAIKNGVLSWQPHANKNEIAKPFDMDEAFKAIYKAVLLAPRDAPGGASFSTVIKWRNQQLRNLAARESDDWVDYNTLRLFGTWWSKDVKVTRQDGLDVIFIPIK